ncbi:15343_t:CDS:1, partial [Entrophospora sp. SA101]
DTSEDGNDSDDCQNCNVNQNDNNDDDNDNDGDSIFSESKNTDT